MFDGDLLRIALDSKIEMYTLVTSNKQKRKKKNQTCKVCEYYVKFGVVTYCCPSEKMTRSFALFVLWYGKFVRNYFFGTSLANWTIISALCFGNLIKGAATTVF